MENDFKFDGPGDEWPGDEWGNISTTNLLTTSHLHLVPEENDFKYEELGDEWAHLDFNNMPTNLLTTRKRSHLVRNTGEEVDVHDHMDGKIVALYFSASSHVPCYHFSSKLVNVYNAQGGFEVVYVSVEDDDCSFNKEFSYMPWLAIPHSDSVSRARLIGRFKVTAFPHLIFINENGRVLTDDGVAVISRYGGDGYPFTPEHLEELKEREQSAKNNQSLQSILVSPYRDFVLSADRRVVPVTELEGKTVGIYFSLSSYNKCFSFTKKLAKIYNVLKERKENFEILSIPMDDDEEAFKRGLKIVPWLSLPFRDNRCEKLIMYFEISALPSLVILGTNGKTLHPNVVDLIEQHGMAAYPFTSQRITELAEMEKANPRKQTLESLLESDERDFLIDTSRYKVPVYNVTGKTVLLYFSALWCPMSDKFTPLLELMYNQLRKKGACMEIIFISLDRDRTSFEEHYSKMPWLALPFIDRRKELLIDIFKVRGTPKLVVIGLSGETVTTEARDLVYFFGSDAYPFTEQRVKQMEEVVHKVRKWPKKIKSEFHLAHELVLNHSQVYMCDVCKQPGRFWVYTCKEC